MQIDILTLFPGMFKGVFEESIIKRALCAKKIKIKIHNLRDWSLDKHKKVDDRPYGGGCGMVINCQPVFDAVRDLKKKNSRVILLSPQGEKLSQKLSQKLSKNKHIILICGHYEGVDDRVSSALVDQEISIGDYILTGGEIPAMVIVDTVARLLPGVLGHKDSNKDESFSPSPCAHGLGSKGILEYPQYTRPAVYKGFKVPQVLLTGNHDKIRQWRAEQAKKITGQKRPDLIQ